MFQKKEYIFSDSIGPCMVEDIVKLAAQKNATPVLYYVLRSVTDQKKTSYIPVENHRALLRPLVSLEEAQAVLAAAWERERAAENGVEAGAQDSTAENGAEAGAQSGTAENGAAVGAQDNLTKDTAAGAQNSGLQEKLLQEAMFVVDRYQKRLEALKESTT